MEGQIFTIEKNWHYKKYRFPRKENLKKGTSFEEKKVQGIFGETFILALSSSAVFCLENHVSCFF